MKPQNLFVKNKQCPTMPLPGICATSLIFSNRIMRSVCLSQTLRSTEFPRVDCSIGLQYQGFNDPTRWLQPRPHSFPDLALVGIPVGSQLTPHYKQVSDKIINYSNKKRDPLTGARKELSSLFSSPEPEPHRCKQRQLQNVWRVWFSYSISDSVNKSNYWQIVLYLYF